MPGKKIATAVPDWEDRLITKRSIIPPPIFPQEAESALAVFKSLRVPDIPGRPTFGEICRPWMFDFVRLIFGAYDVSDGPFGRQLINDFFLLISKKNAKSTLAAGIMVTCLLRNDRPNAELLIIAPTKEVADNSARPAIAMVSAEPELARRIKLEPYHRRLINKLTDSELKIVAADTSSVAGKKASYVLADEWWQLAKLPRAEDMWLEATGGLSSRPEGFTLKLTTHSNEPPVGMMRADLKRFRAIRNGSLVQPNACGVLYEFPERMLDDGSFREPENWYITNPNLGASTSEVFIAQKIAEAEGGDGDEGNTLGVFAKYLNVEIRLNLRSDRWCGSDYWAGLGDRTLTYDSLLARCKTVAIGVDGGGRDDLLGVAAMGIDSATGKWLCWVHAWAHKEALALRKSEGSRYADYVLDGDLTIVNDFDQDVTDVLGIVKKAIESRKFCGIGVDRNGFSSFLPALAEIGITAESGLGMEVTQSLALSGDIESLERKLVDGQFAHSASAMMSWMVSNVKVVPLRNAFMFEKQRAGTDKIDGVMAMINATTVLIRNPEPRGASIYNSAARNRGLIRL